MTEGFLRSSSQSRADYSTTSDNNLYPSYTTLRYTKMSHRSSLYLRYSVMSDNTRSSYAVISDTTLLHTTALNGAILPLKTSLIAGLKYKFTSSTGQPYTLANPLDTVMSNPGSTHQTKTNTGHPYMQNYRFYSVISKPVSTYQTKANICPTRSKGICYCGRSGRSDLSIQNNIAQSLPLLLF